LHLETYSATPVFNLLVSVNYFLEVTMKRALLLLGSLFLAGILYAAGSDGAPSADATGGNPTGGADEVDWAEVNAVLKEVTTGVINNDPIVKQFRLWVDERDSSFENDKYRVSFKANLANLPWQDPNRESSFRVTLKAQLKEYQNVQNAKDTTALGQLDIGIVFRTDALAFVKHIVARGLKLAEEEVKAGSTEVEDQVVLAVKGELAKVKDVNNFAELAVYLKRSKIAFLEALRNAKLSTDPIERADQLVTLAEVIAFLNGITMEEFKNDQEVKKLTLNLERAIASIPDVDLRLLSNTNIVLEADVVAITARLTTTEKETLAEYHEYKPEVKQYVLGIQNRDPRALKKLSRELSMYYSFARMWIGEVVAANESDDSQ